MCKLRSMRKPAFLAIVMAGCSSELEIAPVVDAEGDWTAEFLVNTSADTPGDDVNPFGTLVLGAAEYVPDDIEHIPGEWVGNATFESDAYAAQGSLTDPDVDAEGNPLYENVGKVVLRGTWRTDAEEVGFEDTEGDPYIEISLSCEEVNLTSDRKDLQAICGDPFVTNLDFGCSRPDGSTTLQCFSGQVVFRRK